MSNPHGLKVGQKLWYVPNRSRSNDDMRYEEIESLGREWFKVKGFHQRANMKTMQIDGRGYMSPGTFWPSQEAYVTQRDLRTAWYDLKGQIDRMQMPPTMTLAKIAAIRAILES